MNLNKIWDIIADKNIEPADIFAVVEEVKKMDTSDEENLRKVIRKIAILARRDITPEIEDQIVRKVQRDGVDLSLLNFF